MSASNDELSAAAQERARAHKVWRNTSVFSLAGRFAAALAKRGQCGGRAYPTLRELGPDPRA